MAPMVFLCLTSFVSQDSVKHIISKSYSTRWSKRVSVLLHTDLQFIKQRLHFPLDDNFGGNIECDENGERHVASFSLPWNLPSSHSV